jgi:tripartite-type tricarboxylate transporter receptor subunit TctC
MMSPISNVAVSVAEEREAEELVVRAAKGGLWPALRRRAGQVLSRWMEQQAVLARYGNSEET